MCFAPQRRALFPHRNLQKWSENGVFCTFWLRNVLRATTACTFSTSQRTKVLRPWCVLYILTSKLASRHNGVHFFDVSTAKSGPELVCFVHFDVEMCFAPLRRAIFSSLIWPAGSAPAALASLLFDPPEPQIMGKHSVSRLSYLFTHLHLLSSYSFSSTLLSSNLSLLSASSLLCFSSVHIVGSLTSKLPSSKYPSTWGCGAFSLGLRHQLLHWRVTKAGPNHTCPTPRSIAFSGWKGVAPTAWRVSNLQQAVHDRPVACTPALPHRVLPKQVLVRNVLDDGDTPPAAGHPPSRGKPFERVANSAKGYVRDQRKPRPWPNAGACAREQVLAASRSVLAEPGQLKQQAGLSNTPYLRKHPAWGSKTVFSSSSSSSSSKSSAERRKIQQPWSGCNYNAKSQSAGKASDTAPKMRRAHLLCDGNLIA